MSLARITLEDDICDIIGKAMRGQEYSLHQLAQDSKVPESSIKDILAGKFNSAHIQSLAATLSLSTDALLNLDCYNKTISLPDGLHAFTTAFGYLGVNAYLLQIGNKAIVFDTGTDARPILEHVRKHQLEISAVYITHMHPDHIACVDAFKGSPIIYPETLEHHQELEFSKNPIKVLDVQGHASPAFAFYYDGLATPICLCGDSLFAGSMGKTSNFANYQRALKTISDNLLSLPDDTILCPGHGPLTTIAKEKSCNPFVRENGVSKK
ncbi:MAG: MBL fold metallo-hydrolase [Akkermansiaceae bacterium]